MKVGVTASGCYKEVSNKQKKPDPLNPAFLNLYRT
jgi:hypothetical protein